MPDAATPPVTALIAYDGWDKAAGAIRAAGQLLPDAHAIVTYVRGEPDALEHAAIAAAARLLSGRPALVVHAWSSPVQRSFAGAALLAVPLPEVNDVTRDLDDVFAGYARDLADEGAAQASEAGLAARGAAVEGAPSAWHALAAAARAEAASVIVPGSRGRGAVASTVLGSVSAGLVHNAELPILIAREPDA